MMLVHVSCPSFSSKRPPIFWIVRLHEPDCASLTPVCSTPQAASLLPITSDCAFSQCTDTPWIVRPCWLLICIVRSYDTTDIPLSSTPNTSLILHGTVLDFSAAQSGTPTATSKTKIKVTKPSLEFWVREDGVKAKRNKNIMRNHFCYWHNICKRDVMWFDYQILTKVIEMI